jgi:CheY-like chemotaxis protein
MKRIVLIDDDLDDAGLFREALEEVDASASVHFFDDGVEAIHALSNHLVPLPDLIFLDINMPSMNGWDCLNRLKEIENLTAIPVIMYTTSSNVREKEKTKQQGSAGLITKPDNYKRLKEIISAILITPVEELSKTLQELKS